MGQSSSAAINTLVKGSQNTETLDLLTATTSSSLSNSHRPAAPDRPASFKSLYLNRPAQTDAAPVVPNSGAVQIQH